MVDGDDRARLQAFIEFHIRYCVERQFQARVADDFLHLLSPDARHAVVKLRDDYEQLLRRILVDGAESHGWKVDQVGLIAFGVLTMITDIRLWYRPDGRLSLADVSDFYATFTLRALGDTSVDRPG